MKKLVGILSMQRVPNYGSFLQAYALKQLLIKNGADDVYFIDIEKGKELVGYRQNSIIDKLLSTIYLFVTGKLLRKFRDIKFKKKLYSSIIRNFPILGLSRPLPTSLDLVVIGSDEVFNCCQKSPWGFSTQLYGNVSIAKDVISYAGSFGHTTIEKIKKLGIDNEIADAMKTLKGVSVRDENSRKIVQELIGIMPEVHLDPVLIYGYEQEIAKSSITYPNDYILIYSYQERITEKNEIKSIRNFAKLNKLKIVTIFCRYDWCDEAIVPQTPLEIFGWFKSAKYVVTDTFHGTIFSIITKSNFCSLVHDVNREKLSYLLDCLDLTERGNCNVMDVLSKPVNYAKTDLILKEQRSKSISYLKKFIYNE